MADQVKSDLDNLKVMLGMTGSSDDVEVDELLNLILNNTAMQLKFKTGTKLSKSVPEELNYILIEVAVKRYNRLKNEGMTSYSQEGETISFAANDFDEFKDDLKRWNEQNNAGVLETVDPFRR
jgi:hypothetical protein